MNIVKKYAADFDSSVILTGILPTVRKYDLRYENIIKIQGILNYVSLLIE